MIAKIKSACKRVIFNDEKYLTRSNAICDVEDVDVGREWWRHVADTCHNGTDDGD